MCVPILPPPPHTPRRGRRHAKPTQNTQPVQAQGHNSRAPQTAVAGPHDVPPTLSHHLLTPPPRTKLPVGASSREPLQGSGLRFRSARLLHGSSGTTLGPASPISTRPPLRPGGGRGPASGAHGSSFGQSALSPNSPVECAPAYAGRCYVTPSPGSRVHRIIPFCTGAIPGETPLAMKRRPKMFLKSRPDPQVRRGTPPPLKKLLSLSKGQTGGCQLFDTGTLYVRTVPAFRFASLGGVFAIRLSHPSTPSVRVAPGGPPRRPSPRVHHR